MDSNYIEEELGVSSITPACQEGLGSNYMVDRSLEDVTGQSNDENDLNDLERGRSFLWDWVVQGGASLGGGNQLASTVDDQMTINFTRERTNSAVDREDGEDIEAVDWEVTEQGL